MGSHSRVTNLSRAPASSPLLPLLLLFLLLVLLVPTVVLGRVARESAEKGGEAQEKEKAEQERKLLQEMLDATERTLAFFAEDYSNINVDGLFGMRVAQGQFLDALEECKSSSSCPEELQRRLQASVDKMETAAIAALTYVEEEDADYFSRFRQIIDQPFRLPYTPHTLKDLAKTPPGSDDSYDEETGDGCMARIMGTFLEDSTGKTVAKCNVTSACWAMMTKENTCRYSITHQLIYFNLIQKLGCAESVEAAMKTKVSQAQERMCGSIYSEAVQEAKDGQVLDLYQDLFLEQVLVCGTLGFEDFMRSDWLRMVMRWQKPTGCFSIDNAAMLNTEAMLVKAQEKERQLLKEMKQEANMIEQQHGSGRKLLRERVMQDGCLAHKSGLGFGTLALYTRFLVRQNFIHQ